MQDADVAGWKDTMTALTRLSLQRCTQLTAGGMTTVFAGCRQLQQVDLARTQLNDAALGTLLSECPNVVSLDLSGCRSLTTDGVARILPQWPAMVNLALKDLPELGNRVLFAVAAVGVLGSLDIRACVGMTDCGLKAVLQSCTIKQCWCSRSGVSRSMIYNDMNGKTYSG